jgi:uncharacterized protein (DUF983 family)
MLKSLSHRIAPQVSQLPRDPVELIAEEVVQHQVDPINPQSPLDALTIEAVKRAILDLSAGERDPALTGFLYPMEVVRSLERRYSAVSAAWLQHCEFLIEVQPGEEVQVAVDAHFLVPKVSDLRTRRIVRVEPRVAHLEVSPAKHEDKDRFEEDILVAQKDKGRSPKIVLELALQLERLEPVKLPNGRRMAKVRFRIANVAPLDHDLETQRKTYRLPKAVFGVFAKFRVRGGRVWLPDEVPDLLDSLKKLGFEQLDISADMINTYLRRSKKEPDVVVATPIVIYDRPRYSPKPGDEAAVRSNAQVWRVLEAVKEALGIRGPLYKYQVEAIQEFLEAFSSRRGKAIVSIVPTAFGKSALNSILSILTCALERKKGPKVFLFFPTRPLSIQQLGDLIKCVYALRRRDIAELTVGLFMGKGPRDVPVEEALAPTRPQDAVEGEEIRLIASCPACGSGPIVVKKPSEDRVVPTCSKCGHEMDYVYLTDGETQTCPDIIVATPDKLVYELMRWEHVHVLIGAPARICPGCSKWNPEFLASCKWCGHSLRGTEVVRAEPVFFAFDEFHLLSGMVGNMLSHFIRLIRLLRRKYLGEARPEIFSLTTATSGRPEEFTKLFTGIDETGGSVKLLKGSEYFEPKREVWQRILLLDPLDISTRGSISWEVIALKKAIDELSTSSIGDVERYRQQLIYVQRKEDGHDLEEYIPLLARDMGVQGVSTVFIHGDQSRSELAERIAKLGQGRADVGIVTVIMAYGVHLPRLNVLHIFGSPNSTSEFFQVIGRTGREEESPALVLLHLYPGYPRDRWLRANFIRWVSDPQFEPEPIEPANLSAVRATSISVLTAYLLSYAYEYMSWLAGRLAGEVIEEKLASEALEEVTTNVYMAIRGGGMPTEVKQELLNAIQEAAYELLDAARSIIGPLPKFLDERRLLLASLRSTEERVRYEAPAPVGFIRMMHGLAEEVEGE